MDISEDFCEYMVKYYCFLFKKFKENKDIIFENYHILDNA